MPRSRNSASSSSDAPAAADHALVPSRRHDGWTVDRQRAFLEHLAAHGCVRQAAKFVGLSRQSAYAFRDEHPRAVFAMAWSVAVHRAHRLLVEEAIDRAINGRKVAVIYRGEQVGTRIVHNDRLLTFLIAHNLRSPRPDLSDDQMAEIWPALLDQVETERDSAFPAVREAEARRDAGEDG